MDREIGGEMYTDDVAGSAVAIAGPPTLRMEFGSHLEANYPRLVAQLSMITLDVAQAHKLVDDVYARAWQRWSVVRELPDPTAWIRQMAVRASARKRPILQFRRKRAIPDNAFEQPANTAAYAALGQLKPYIRRPLVLADVAHLSIEEVARVEGIVEILAESRVVRGREELSLALRTDPGAEAGAATAWEQM